MKKKIVTALAMLMVVATLGACGNDGSTSGNNSSGSSGTSGETGSGANENTYSGGVEKVVISFLAFSMPTAEEEKAVEEAMNAITREKIGVEVDLLIMDGASYGQQLPLMLSGGEQVDAYSILGMNLSSMVNSGYTLDLEENGLLQNYGQGIINEVGDLLDGCRVNGTLYALPQNRDYASPDGYMIVAEYLDGIGYEYDATKANEITEEELEDIFTRLHETYPDKTVLVEQQVARTAVFNDYPGDWYGVLMDPANSLELTDLYSSQEYMDYCKKHYRWNQLGFISADALTNEDAATSLVNAGSAMAYACGIKAGIVSQESQNCGRQMVAFLTNDRYILPSGASAMMPWCVNSNTDCPEATIRLLNEFYTNPEMTDLLTYGIEGVDYVVNEEGLYTFPEGTDASSVGYHPNVAVFMFNEFIAGVWEGNDPDIWEQTREMNENAVISKAMGFSFDNSSVATEYTAINNVYEEYRNQLEYGFLDPETGIPEMVEKMNRAGLEKYIAEKQRQLDEWAAAQE